MLEENQNSEQLDNTADSSLANVQEQNKGNFLRDMQSKKERNIANNAKNVRVAADIASKSGNPYAKAIGEAVKAADKLSGGRASKKLGKTLNTANKITPGGRILQNGLNKMSESGTSSRISNAVNKKKTMPTKSPMSVQGGAEAKGKDNDYFSRKEVEEQTSDGGGVSFQVTVKFIKTALIAMIPVMVVVVFLNLLTSASLAVRNIIGIGSADTISDADMQNKIESADQDTLENKDESNVNKTAFDYDLFIEDESILFRNSKLKKINNETVTRRREYNEADITQLKDYYPDIANYEELYESDIIYTFFFKLHYLYFYYQNKYNATLDIPLLMSTLSINSNDMQNVFESNIIGYDADQVKLKSDNDRFSYTKQISYESTSTRAEYDMEILAQYMISKVPYVESEKTCKPEDVVEGMCYIVDYNKYEEFLREYLEKKYYEGGILSSPLNSNSITPSGNVCATNQFTKYELTDDQIAQIASLAIQEQGTTKGAAAEASLMANLFEIKGSKYGSGASGLYNYIRNSGWFAKAATHMDSYKAGPETIAAVKSVLVDGKRTLPGYIDEHDYIGDINYAATDGEQISVNDRSSYKKYNTKLKNIYGSTYTFYSFPDVNSDPFGYTSEKIRKEKGDFYYDFDTGNPVNCSSSTSSSNSYADAIIDLANKEYEINAGKSGEKYNSYFGYSSSTAWCANFVSYLISNTSINGVFMYPNIIDFRTASTGTFMKSFSNSSKENLKFYYNDSCKFREGKNEQGVYTPKKGDIIFFDWAGKFKDMESSFGQQDHTAIVEKYVDGVIHTIEGNMGNPSRIKKFTYSISDCRIIGFGSWY